MERYAPIHPERPLRRAAIAVAVSLGVHAALLAVLAVVVVAAVAAQKRREAESPKQVALESLDAERWEANRRFESQELPGLARKGPIFELPPKGAPGERPQDGKDSRLLPGSSSKGFAAVEGPDLSLATPDGAAPPSPGPMLDLRPRPLASRPLVMNLKPLVGEGGLPEGQETGFANLTVHHPEAWRFSLFFRRAVENMDGVFRYELGAPFPYSLRLFAIANPRVGHVCSYTAIELDGAGKLVSARVQKSSGLPEVDQLILEVIRRTSPFANLPAGLTDERGIYGDSWGLCLVWGRG